MRRMTAVAALVVALMAAGACTGDGGDPPAAPPPGTSGPSPGAPTLGGGPMSTEEYCEEFAPEEILPLAQEYSVQLEEVGDAVETGDQPRIEAAVSALQEQTDELTGELRDAAEELTDGEFAGILLRIAGEFDAFVADVAAMDPADYGNPASVPTGVELQAAMEEAQAYC